MGFKSKILKVIKKIFGITDCCKKYSYKYSNWKKVKGVGRFPQNNPKDEWEEILKGNDYY